MATPPAPPPDDLQARCELGQQQLMRTEYLQAEATLVSAEVDAWLARDFDTLARLYMPLQEARRQRRQLCGEGQVVLDLITLDMLHRLDAAEIVERYPQGQLLVAGFGSLEPSLRVRELQRERQLYLETFLAATFRIVGRSYAVVIVPLENVTLPDANQERSIDELIRLLPAQSIVLDIDELPEGPVRGNSATYASVMSLWERLHKPFLAAADMLVDPLQKIEAYRKTQRVDYGCELAHQKAADVARELARYQRQQPGRTS